MCRFSRLVAMLLVTLLLPVQGYAAACAQICAVAGHVQAPADHGAGHHGHTDDDGMLQHGASHDGDSVPDPHDGCDNSTFGAGKCCQAHVFVVADPHVGVTLELPAPARTFYVARWTSFIPEEPSPPPIGDATDA